MCGWRPERAAVCTLIPRAPRTPEEGPLSHLRGPRGRSPAPWQQAGELVGRTRQDLVLSHLGSAWLWTPLRAPGSGDRSACVLICSGLISLKGGAWGVQGPQIWACV